MSQPDQDFVFLPLGGVGEIGMNCALYGFGPPRKRQWIIVDLGVSFGSAETPGVDLIMPDLSFVEKIRKDILAIFITHAHEDHIGALADLWPKIGAPVYMTRFAMHVAEARRLAEPGAPDVPLKLARYGEPIQAGPFPKARLSRSARRSARSSIPATGSSIPIRSSASRRTPRG